MNDAPPGSQIMGFGGVWQIRADFRKGARLLKYVPHLPLIVQQDGNVLLDTKSPGSDEAKAELMLFAEMVKSPGHIHTYRITPLTLWNAAAAGISAGAIIRCLDNYGKFELPSSVRQYVTQYVHRYGVLRIEKSGGQLLLICTEPDILVKLLSYPSLGSFIVTQLDEHTVLIDPSMRGTIKRELIKIGFPVKDMAGFNQGEALPCPLAFVSQGSDGYTFVLRDYQRTAVDNFFREGSADGGSGVLVLPCGSGKTVIGIAALVRLQCATLILAPNVTSVRQWKEELIAKTTLPADMIGEYDGERKEVKPVTIATYQILTHRKSRQDDFSHMQLFNRKDWGLIVYDEVHLLPAPVFRVTAEIQATRRLGLTATLVREDGREEDVFTLIGPKRYSASWKDLEHKGWIAKVHCTELRVPMTSGMREQYARAETKNKPRIAGENPLKLDAVRELLHKHAGTPTLIIGQYLEQLSRIASAVQAPVINGDTPHDVRDELYRQFNSGELGVLVVSKVANFAVDLPDAGLAIQISGSFGSRQEEAQRLGRILRPKQGTNEAYFYTIVTENTREQDFALNRQLFLTEQGYVYRIENAAAADLELNGS